MKGVSRGGVREADAVGGDQRGGRREALGGTRGRRHPPLAVTARRPWVAATVANPVAPRLFLLCISLSSPEDALRGGQHLACRPSPSLASL